MIEGRQGNGEPSMQAAKPDAPVVWPDATVALLDALGTRSLDRDGAIRRVLSIRDVVEKSRWLLRKTAEKTPGLAPAPFLRVFGDTVLLAWTHHQDSGGALRMTSLLAQQVFVGCLANNIPMRGAVGHGDVIWDQETALGTAVDDAAEWHEKADWLGVVAAPTCARALDDLAQREGEEWASNFYIRYGVPFKAVAPYPVEMWALSWPQEWTLHAMRTHQPDRELLGKKLAAIRHKPEHEPKYAAAAEFFEHYMSRWAGSSMRIREAEGRPLA